MINKNLSKSFPVKVFGMEIDVFFNESRNVKETVVVSCTVFPQVWIIRLDQLFFQVVNQHLFSELVSCSDINECGNFMVVSWSDYLSCIILFSLNFWIVKEQIKCFNSPVGWFWWVTYWCKCWYWLELSCFQSWNQSSMASHAETCDWNVCSADWEICWNDFWKLFVNVRKHLEKLFGFIIGCINIVTCTVSSFPIFRNTSETCVSWTCIWENNSNSVLVIISGKSRFLRSIIMSASKSW